MNNICAAEPCPVILNSTCVFYRGANLIYTGVLTNDNLQTVIEKIDNKFKNAAIGYAFNNGITQAPSAGPVQLGGLLLQNTTITSDGFDLNVTETINAGKFATIGGTSSQFVKGDGSLDSTSYQPSGTYIASLTGDGTAVGPGSAVFTLTDVNTQTGTYGSGSAVPTITVDSKGRITSVFNNSITYPAQTVTVIGDVYGSGPTNNLITLTLNNVNSNIYSTNTILKFAVNAKGLVTSAAPITGNDIENLLGYTPVPSSRTLTINGVTHDLSVNRSWTITAGATIWGTITGTITNQTDLTSYLSTNYTPQARTLTINGTTYDLSANRSWTVSGLPSQSGNAGKWLTTDGSTASWASLPPSGVSAVTATSPLASSGGSTPNITIQQASGSQNGYLSSTDWTTFNSKLSDAPSDGTTYGRKNGAWSAVTSNPGTVTSVGLSMPSAFTVTNSPVTSSGTLTVAGAGLASQYVRGDGTLATFPTSGGGGSSVVYYLNGSVNQGTFGGNIYYQLSKTAITTSPGTDFTIATNGIIARFITDANDPGLLSIPGGNWNMEFYFSSSSSGGSPTFYINVYKYNGTFTLIGTNSTAPEGITNGTTIDSYYTSVTIPTATLTVTDRLAIEVYVANSGRTITMHTEDNHVSEVITTFSTGLTALNGLTAQVQYFQTGTTGTDFGISSVTNTHTFNLPTASATNTGKLSSSDWSEFNSKIGRIVSSISSNTNAGSSANTDYIYLVSGTTTVTLPTAVGNTNQYTIKNVGTNTISIATTSSQTIDGSSSPITINVQYVSLTLISDGTNWNII